MLGKFKETCKFDLTWLCFYFFKLSSTFCFVKCTSKEYLQKWKKEIADAKTHFCKQKSVGILWHKMPHKWQKFYKTIYYQH